MSKNNELLIRISADAKKFEYALDKAQKKTEELQEQLQTAAKISGAAFVALSGTIAGSVLAAGKFEQTFSSVVTQLDKTSFSTKTLDKGIEDLKKGVIALGVKSGESFEVLNTGLFDIVSAGIPAEKALETLAAANELAIAGASDTASAVKALVAAYTSYGEAAGNANEVAEAFFTASKYGVTDVEGLATEFNKIAGLSRTLGISFNEALGSATALTNNGAKPVAQAFNQFEAVLNGIILAQSKLKDESLAVQQALSLENVQAVGVNEALRQLQVATGGNVATMQRLLGSSNALAAVLSLTGAQAKDVDKIMAGLNDTTSRTAAFQEALKTKQETLNNATERFKRSFEAAAITLGEKFVPLIIGTANFMSSLAQKFNDLSPYMIKVIALFLGLATALTGFIASASLAASAFLNIRNAVLALNVVFGVGKVAAATFWGAATLGVSLLLTALPAIIGYVGDLVDKFKSFGQAPKGLQEINSELERMRALRDRVANQKDVNFGDRLPEQLAAIDTKIAALEKLKKKEEEVKAVAAGKTPAGNAENPTASTKPDEPKVKDEETKRRIALAEAEAEKMKQIRDSVAQEEINFEARRAEIKQAAYEAQKIRDDEERALALANIQARNEQLLLEEADYQYKREEAVMRAREQQAILDEEYQALEDEKKAALRQKDLDELNSQVMTEEQIANEAAKKKLARKIEERNQYLRDEQQYGKQYANIQKVLNSEQLAMASQAANALVGMQQSKNNTLKTIGKAAGLTQLGIDTAVTAMSAYQAMAKIPVVGPALGAAAAAAVIAYGVERSAQILAANEGGRVPMSAGAMSGVDSVPSMLTPGELVVPAQNYEEVIDAVAAQRTGTPGQNGGGGSIIIQGDFYGEETFIDRLAEKLFDAQRTRNVQLIPT
jgi:TP901 family phage tail tape measure protein